MIQILVMLVALLALLITISEIAHMSRRTRPAVRLTYIVLACGSFAELTYGFHPGCEPAGLIELLFGIGVLMLLCAQHRTAWKLRPELRPAPIRGRPDA